MEQKAKASGKHGFIQVVLVSLLVLSAFFIGSLYTKIQYLEKSSKVNLAPGRPTAPQVKSKYANFTEAMSAIAREIKIDEKKLTECLEKGNKKSLIEADLAQGNKLGVAGTPVFFLNGRLISGALPFSEFKKVIDEELSGKTESGITRVTVDLGEAPTQGTANAAVVLIEFSDFQCPYCVKAILTVKEILKEYQGKVLFVYKHFPLSSIHPRAQKAGEAAECARDQGKFWEFHDKLFENQQDWSNL
ncbi:MAG: DsbA family protein [Patescibacteria group bacterium]